VQTLHEPILLGSGGTLAACAEWASDADVVMSLYGDLLVSQSIAEIVKFHGSHSYPFTLSVKPTEEPTQKGIATVNSEGVVTEFVEKPAHPNGNLSAAGMYAMSPKVLTEIAKMQQTRGLPLDLGGDVIPTLLNRMKAYFAEGEVFDIGTMDAYSQAQDFARHHGFGR
jgi:NDP-sugar pyrophosphorylase family protein